MAALERNEPLSSAEEATRITRWPWSIERTAHLDQPYVTAGNRVYCIASQHGEFPEIGWRQPSEMAGVWDHPIKLLDGFWFGVTSGRSNLVGLPETISWLTQAQRWHMSPGEVMITYQLADLEVTRCEYGVDDREGMIVRLHLSNRGEEAQAYMLHFLARTDLRAAWLGESRLAWRDGRDEAVYAAEHECIMAYNTVNPAYVLFGATRRPAVVTLGNELWETRQDKGQGIAGHLGYRVDLPAHATQELTFIIAGSTRSSEAAIATFRQLQAEPGAFCERQCQRYRYVMECCALHSDDELIDTAFGWAKVNLQMLERDVPGVGHGLAAGLPDFPWWFGDDTAYSTLPLVATGQFELALASLRNLAAYSEAVNSNGGVVHEVLTQGHVHDTGHVVETLLFIRAVYHAFRWTGDRTFLSELYTFCKRGLLDVVLGACDPDGDLCALGKGMVETHELLYGEGFETLDIAAYTYEALLDMAELAQESGDSALVPVFREKARQLRSYVNEAWWIEEEGLFGDIYTSAAQLAALHKILWTEEPLWRGDLVELEHTKALLEKQYILSALHGESLEVERPWLLKHMIIATPMETGLATAAHAAQALARLESNEFTGPWGIYLNPERQPVTMTLPTGIMAVAEAQYHRMDQALDYSHKIASTFFHGMPGAFSEVSPDGGCFIQAWSSYGIIWPVVHYFLGFRPNVSARSVNFIPHLPGTWHTARLQAVRVGTATMHLEVMRTAREQRVILETSDPLYSVTLGSICNMKRKPERVALNGEALAFHIDFLGDQSPSSRLPDLAQLQIEPVTGLHRYELRICW
jgi:glycogen debranching enzyme